MTIKKSNISGVKSSKKEQRKQKTINLYCESFGGVGMGWISELSFRPLASGGYSLFARDDGQWSRWTKIHESHEPLTWRSAARDIQSIEDVGLGGDDLLSEIRVTGVPEWAADILRLCWVKYDGPEKQKLFLLTLDDSDIEGLWRHNSSLCSSKTLDRLETLGTLVEQAGLWGRNFTEIAHHIGFSCTKDNLLKCQQASLKHYVSSKGIDLHLEKKRSGYIVEPTILSELMSLPSPRPGDTAVRLLYSWVVAGSPPLEFLKWLFNEKYTRLLGLFNKKYPNEARMLVAWVHDKGKKSAWYLEAPGRLGGGMGAHLGSLRHRSWINFAQNIEEAAKKFNIKI